MKNNYKHAIVIGTDGMGNFNAEASTPRMDEIFGNSAVTYSALSMDPTISAENWGAMLLGATPVVHGLTNSIIGKREYHNDALPSVFRRIRKAVPDACLASYCNWNPINHGIVEHDLGVDLQTADDDIILTDKIVDCVAKKPMFLFVQLDDIDHAGHAHGYGTPEYLEKITDTDALIGKIYDAYC
ncbi:MAG: nucleotide pyrophosphatase, partial [Clostridiales bacterium]|nr:nucleotide pyrophosphatase [Clostridiales bacterium]